MHRQALGLHHGTGDHRCSDPSMAETSARTDNACGRTGQRSCHHWTSCAGGDPAGKTVVGHLRDLAYLGLAEWHVCGHRSDRCIAARRCYDAVAIYNRRHHVAEPLPVLPSGAGEDLVGVGMIDTAHGIHGRDGAYYDVSAGAQWLAVTTEAAHFRTHG